MSGEGDKSAAGKAINEDMNIPGLDEEETDMFYMISMSYPID